MFGVNTAAEHLTGRDKAQIGQTQTTSASSSGSSNSSGQGTVSEVAANAMPSLVTISTMTVEEMRNFFGGTQQYEVEGAGTGVIVGENDTELLIATNYHVVEGANSLSVGFVDEHSVEARVKGMDVENDLAVVSVKLSDIPDDTMSQIATIGNSDELQLGDQVVAIGNALGYGQSVTSGYVSAMDRDLTLTYEDGTTITSTGLIQTDAAINSGNSGGALLNMKGLQEMMNQETREKVDEDQASYLGIQGSDVSTEVSELYGVPSGVVVAEVVENGPAADAGMQRGDIITSFDGRTISSMEQLQQTLEYYAAGEQVDVTVQRSDNGAYQEQTLTVTLGSAAELQNQ